MTDAGQDQLANAESAVEDPRITRSRAAILAAARAEFVAHGFVETSVTRVAEAAGVTKRTIYNIYADKETLFRQTILSAISIADGFLASFVEQMKQSTASPAQLPAVAEQLAVATLVGPVLSLRRLLIMESDRFPELASEYRRRAPDAVLAALTDVMNALMKKGTLAAGDPTLAAEHFAFLVMGAELDRAMFAPRALAEAEVASVARAGAEVFLRAYAV